MNRQPLLWIVFFVFAMVVATTQEAKSTTYDCTLLDVPGTLWSRAWDINDAGQVVGDAGGPSPVHYAVIWGGSTATVLPTPQGFQAAAARGINESGQISGQADNSPVRWDNSTPEILGIYPGTYLSWDNVWRINNSGQTAGWVNSVGGAPENYRPIVWDGTTPELLYVPGGLGGYAYDVNDYGQVVGRVDNKPVRWNALGQPLFLNLPQGKNTGVAWAINDSGQAVGATGGLPVRWDGTTPTLMELPEGTVLGYFMGVADINEAGVAVGWVQRNDDGSQLPVLWDTITPIMLPLPAGMTEGHAYGINSAGQVVGCVWSDEMGSLYIPVRWDLAPVPVPEPSTMLLLGTGLVGLAGLRRKFRKQGKNLL